MPSPFFFLIAHSPRLLYVFDLPWADRPLASGAGALAMALDGPWY